MPAEVTLTANERRVLETVIQYSDPGMTPPTIQDIAAVAGISRSTVQATLRRLSEATPPYISFLGTSANRGSRRRIVVSERGRRAIREWRNTADIGSRPLRIFCSYSHRDEKFRIELEIRLTTMRRKGLIEEWNDRKITAGQEWEHDIDKNLEAADIVLLLVSSDFLASDYCYDREFMRALDRHKAAEARVVPIILRHSDWRETPIGQLQVLPPEGKPVAGRGDRAWQEVTTGLWRVVRELRKGH
jgi:DNA-binding MarR family transcriptional regulator